MSDLTQQNIDRFNTLAAEWDSSPGRVTTATAVAGAICDALKPSSEEAVLEFGCGTGLLTAALAPRVGHILAMDSAPRMLDTLNSKLGDYAIDNIDTHVGDLPGHPPPGRFDLIISSMTLHHIDDTAGLLAVLFGLLRPGGHIALADLDAEDGSFHGDKPGIAHRGFDRGELASQMTEAGFDDVHFSTAHRMEKTGEDDTTRTFPIFLVTARRCDGLA